VHSLLRDERDALARELAEVRRQRDEAIAALKDLQRAVDERWRAEREVQRLKELQRAEREAHEPNTRLH
jgi:hypothetical protein